MSSRAKITTVSMGFLRSCDRSKGLHRSLEHVWFSPLFAAWVLASLWNWFQRLWCHRPDRGVPGTLCDATKGRFPRLCVLALRFLKVQHKKETTDVYIFLSWANLLTGCGHFAVENSVTSSHDFLLPGSGGEHCVLSTKTKAFAVLEIFFFFLTPCQNRN